MKRWLSVITAACLLLYPFAAFAADYGSQSSSTEQAPPVAQPLVREGDFAIKLAAELDLGHPDEETSAEDMLAGAGIVPLNGWLSDYPMTPEIIAQLQSSIAKAASEGRIPLSADEGTRGLYSLTSRMNLPTPAGFGSPAKAGTEVPALPSNPTVINNYYAQAGPPIITYYPPPYYDAYLYDWVAFPVIWYGFWFPGFYICHSFTTVIVTGDFDHDHGRGDFDHDRGRGGIVTNRVVDPETRRVAFVDATACTTGSERPTTMLRTGSGTPFRNVSDLRRGYAMPGVSTPGAWVPRTPGSGSAGFRTPEARRSAETIYSRSMNNGMVRPPEGALRERIPMSPGAGERMYGSPPSRVEIPSPGENRSFGGTGSMGRTYESPAPQREERQPRFFSAPSQGGAWQHPLMQSNPSRSFNTPMIQDRTSLPVRPFTGSGWAGRAGSITRGAFCRGRC